MTGNDALSVYADRMGRLVRQDMEIAADLRELAKEMRDVGLQAAVLKAWVKAQVKADDGDDGPLIRLKEKTQFAAIYAEALGIPIDGFGTNQIHVNELPPHDPATGEIKQDAPRPSTSDKPSPEVGPQAEASPVGTDSGTPAGHDGRHEAGGGYADEAATDHLDGQPAPTISDDLDDMPEFLRRDFH